ncbi:MAG: hypothetical protein ACI8W8_003506, partial [Rhodothermales bacterium]
MDNLQLIKQLGELPGEKASIAFEEFLRGNVR